MPVFKVFEKIIKKNLGMLAIYIAIFVGITAVYQAAGVSRTVANFTETQCSVTFVNGDGDSALTRGLMDFIGERSKVVSFGDDGEALQDALFFQRVDYIVRIPAGFAQSFMGGGDARLEVTSAPSSPESVYMELLTDNYLNSARLYAAHVPGITQAELARRVSADLSLAASVELKDYGSGLSDGAGLAQYFSFISYPLTLILMFGITSFMLAFNDALLKRRMLCSPVSPREFGVGALGANLVFTVAVWALMLAAAFAMCGPALLSANGLLWAANLLCAALVGLSLSFMIGSLIRSKNVQSAVTNTLGLGLAFLSGSFVPQSLLGERVLSVARFLPTYWYVKASDEIGNLKAFGWSGLGPVCYGLLIQLGFAAALVCVTLVINRNRRAAAI